jgi:hypothetical protein
MRFGIHSGDTTAGILRGTKSRFELFGDTINTASRMESTGLPGKIQVSEETAMLIQRDSKSQWLTKRDTTITAKGKGEMQTYWAEPHRLVSFSDAIPADDHFLNRNQGLLRGSLQQGSSDLRNSLSQWSETGESQEKDSSKDRGNSTPNSRRSSVELMDATVEDKCDGDIDSDIDSDIDPDFAKLMNITRKHVDDAGSSADNKV